MISVLIPALNEEATIVEVVNSHISVLQIQAEYEFEVIVLNDGSTDQTKELLNQNFSENPHVRIFENESPSGIASAFAQLLSLARGEWLYFTSADGQFPAECLRLLSNRISGGAELIVGDRRDRLKIYGWKRKVVSWAYRRLSQLLFWVDPVDPGSVKIIKKSSYPNELISKSVTRDLEIIIVLLRQKRNVEFVPIPFLARLNGTESGGSMKVVWNAFVDLLKLRFMLRGNSR